ncbi:MAG: C1 family peptidase [Candidatus Eisenbacteria sp.]|nr:C1 family peptidase [Candidatus Eisenbacteria bacterium]
MSRFVTVLAILLIIPLVPAALFAGGDTKGGLSSSQISVLRSSFKVDDETRAIMNAVANNKLREIALDQEAKNAAGMLFSDKIETKGVTDQSSTGRCWMYAGLNVLRPGVIEKYDLEEFEFSETYLFFWDKIEKANLFLESIIERRNKSMDDREVDWLFKHPLPDGGQWNMVVALIEKYGVVPIEVVPENEQSKQSKVWNGLLSRKLRKDALELRRMHEKGKKLRDLRARKMEMLEEAYRVLAITLGEPPAQFDWRYEDKDGNVSEPKTYTPRQFYEEVCGVDLGEYVYFLSNPLQDFGKMYEITFDRDMYDRPNMTVANVLIGDLRAYTLKSILDGEPVWFGCDVGKEHFRDKGAGMMKSGIYRYDAVYGVDFSMTRKDRLLSSDGVPSHAMIFTGVDMRGNDPVKWLVENSWGTDYGDDGMWMMSDQWFNDYVYGAVIHRKYLPDEVLAMLDMKPIVLPPWDPMFDAAMWR